MQCPASPAHPASSSPHMLPPAPPRVTVAVVGAARRCCPPLLPSRRGDKTPPITCSPVPPSPFLPSSSPVSPPHCARTAVATAVDTRGHRASHAPPCCPGGSPSTSTSPRARNRTGELYIARTPPFPFRHRRAPPGNSGRHTPSLSSPSAPSCSW